MPISISLMSARCMNKIIPSAKRPPANAPAKGQMLGRTIADPLGVEGRSGAEVAGLRLLDVRTDFAADKTLRLPTGEAFGVPARGYEIHHGRITAGSGERPAARMASPTEDPVPAGGGADPEVEGRR